MYLVIALFVLFMGFQIWSLRAYMNFMATHPEIEKRLVERAMRENG